MSEVERFDGMLDCTPDGCYVRHSDYLALEESVKHYRECFGSALQSLEKMAQIAMMLAPNDEIREGIQDVKKTVEGMSRQSRVG
jgi:hypothetical protein